MLDDETLILLAWTDGTGVQAPKGEGLERLLEFTYAIGRAALGQPRFSGFPKGHEAEIKLSEAMTSMDTSVIDDIWDEHQVRERPTDPAKVHRFVFLLGLLERPDRTGNLPLEAPAPETCEWLWLRGVDEALPGQGLALAHFINAVLVKARHDFLAKDKRLEDWELSEALDGDIIETDDVWAATSGLDAIDPKQQRRFRKVVGWYLNPRLAGGELTLGPTGDTETPTVN